MTIKDLQDFISGLDPSEEILVKETRDDPEAIGLFGKLHMTYKIIGLSGVPGQLHLHIQRTNYYPTD